MLLLCARAARPGRASPLPGERHSRSRRRSIATASLPLRPKRRSEQRSVGGVRECRNHRKAAARGNPSDAPVPAEGSRWTSVCHGYIGAPPETALQLIAWTISPRYWSVRSRRSGKPKSGLTKMRRRSMRGVSGRLVLLSPVNGTGQVNPSSHPNQTDPPPAAGFVGGCCITP